MPRPPRLHTSGLIYHVFSRGNNREPIFFNKRDYARFLENLERYRTSYNYFLYAYCLMPNHFHLLLQVSDTNHSKIMQVLMTAYTMYINKKYERVGHLFQGRFKSIIVQKETYLLEVLRYIHLNPVKVGLVENAESYLWSSYNGYLVSAPGSVSLNTAEILSMFSQDVRKQRDQLQEFTVAGLKQAFDPFKEQSRGVLGDSRFRQKLTKVLKGVRP